MWVSSPQEPVCHSSPQTSDHRHPSNISGILRITSRSSQSSHVPVPGKKPYNSLRIAVMNVNSIRNRKAELEEFTEYVKPDLILFTKTKIDASIANSEFLPQEYSGNIRADRTSDGGGVIIAARKGIDITGLEICENTTESVWAKIITKCHPPILVGCFYRRDSESSIQQVEELDKVLSYIEENHNKKANCTILLDGDFNVPDIDWETPATKPGCRHKGLCDKLIEVTSDYHLEQVQQKPTRLDNILDLLFTNKPALIKEVSVIPGLSDHSTVIIDTFLHNQPNQKTPRKINQWSRANWEEMKREVRDYQEQYFNTAPSQSAEQRN